MVSVQAGLKFTGSVQKVSFGTYALASFTLLTAKSGRCCRSALLQCHLNLFQENKVSKSDYLALFLPTLVCNNNCSVTVYIVMSHWYTVSEERPPRSTL